MYDIKFDGEMTIGSRKYNYINGEYFTRYYWYNPDMDCWCGYIGIPEEVFNQLDEYYACNTFLGKLDDYHFVIGNDDYSFSGIQDKLNGMEEELLRDYGGIIRNDYKHKLLRTKAIMECKLVVIKTLTDFLNLNKYDVSHLKLLLELNKELNDKLTKLQEK